MPLVNVRLIEGVFTPEQKSEMIHQLTEAMVIVGLSAAIAGSGTPYRVSPGNTAAAGVSVALIGVLFAQLVMGVVGVLAFSGEYGTGMIRATLAVVPVRLPVLWAKLITLAGLVLPVSMLCAFAGSSSYLTVVVVIGLALGALFRKTAAGLSVFAAVFFVIPVTVRALPPNLRGFAPYLPSNAGGAL
jgi:hypothetical protein